MILYGIVSSLLTGIVYSYYIHLKAENSKAAVEENLTEEQFALIKEQIDFEKDI